MIRARIPDDENGKVTVIVGLAGYELNKLVAQAQPVMLDMVDIGVNVNLILIARPGDDQCIEVVKNAVDGDIKIIDKRSDLKDAMKAALEARTQPRIVKIPMRRGGKHRPTKKRR